MIKVSLAAKRLIVLVVLIWAGMYLYVISMNTPPFLDNYEQRLSGTAEKLNNNIEIAKGLKSESDLMLNYRLLCQTRICQGDFAQAQQCLQQLAQLNTIIGLSGQKIWLKLICLSLMHIEISVNLTCQH